MLEARHLYKTFGSTVAVNDVSFDVKDGEILGLIGRNGSGKTTIFRLLLGFYQLEKDGKMTFDGRPHKRFKPEEIGFLPEERGLYDRLTIEEQVVYFGELRGFKKEESLKRLNYWMERFDVKGKTTDKVTSLSKGNQQKVQLILTMIHEPKFLILDEPFSGLDPVNADLLKEGIFYLKEKGSSIIFSSHNMSNVEELCDSLVMIDDGNQILYGPVEDVRQSFGMTRLVVTTKDWSKEDLSHLEGVLDVEKIGTHRYRLKMGDELYGKALFNEISKGQYLSEFHQQAPTLEEIFKMKAGGRHE